MFNNEISIKEQVVDKIIVLRAIRFNKEVGILKGLFESDKKVHGNLANVDLDHKDRLVHFYKKHGYSIVEENEEKNYWGKITKEL